MAGKEYDFMLFGATGYTGRLCAKFIVKNYNTNTRWAVAGRSPAALKRLVSDLAVLNPDRTPPGVVTFTKLDEAEIGPLVQKTCVVINGIGPFHRFSTPIVAACAKSGTHYVDFTTETLWMRDIIDKYEKLAVESGAVLIPGITPGGPPDLLAYLIASEILTIDDSGTSEVISAGKLDIQGMSGGSATTVLDSLATWGPWWFLFGNSWILAPRATVPSKIPRPPFMSWLFGYRQVSELGGALTTSFVGINNEPIVHRSCAKNPKLYGTKFHFKEYLPVGKSRWNFLSAGFVHFCTYFGVLVISIPPLRALLRMLLPAAGLGPDIAEARAGESVVYHAVGIPSSRQDMRAHAVFQRQGSLYEFTALMACVAARVIRDKTAIRGFQGGFSTPSSLGMEYVEALRGAGVEIGVSLEPCKLL